MTVVKGDFKPGEKVVFKDMYVDAAGIKKCYWRVAVFYYYRKANCSEACVSVVGDPHYRIVSISLLFRSDSEHSWVYGMYLDEVRKKKKKRKRLISYLVIAVVICLVVWGFFVTS